jgi:uncharacterized alkaline shock family protein YloU
VSETSAGNVQAYDTERGSPRQATSTAPYHEPGTGPLPGRQADRPRTDLTGAPPQGEPGAGALPIEAAAFGRQQAPGQAPGQTTGQAPGQATAQATGPVSRAGVETTPGLEPLPPPNANPPPMGSYGMQPRLSSPAAQSLPSAAPPPASAAVPLAAPVAAPAASSPSPTQAPPPAAPAPPAAPPADIYPAAKSGGYGTPRTRVYERPATEGYGQAATAQAPDDEITVLSAPVSAGDRDNRDNRAEQVAAGPPLVAVVKGRVQIEDEVVEKVAGLAAVEVAGVADLGGNIARAFEAARDHLGAGHRRGTQGVRARIEDRQVAIHVVIVIEYGAVVMEVAKAVKANVARAVSHMLGLRVVEVNVTVDDVSMPRHPAAARAADTQGAAQVTDPFA